MLKNISTSQNSNKLKDKRVNILIYFTCFYLRLGRLNLLLRQCRSLKKTTGGALLKVGISCFYKRAILNVRYAGIVYDKTSADLFIQLINKPTTLIQPIGGKEDISKWSHVIGQEMQNI